MRLRKPVAAAASLGVAAALFGVVAPAADAGSPAQSFAMTCVGDDNVLAGSAAGSPTPSQDIVNLLGQLAGTGATTISLTAQITPDVPATMTQGETQPVSFDFTTVLEQSTIDAAVTAGITTINVSNLKFGVIPTGADPATELVVTPPNTSIDLTASPIVFPSFTLDGSVTADSVAPIENILYQIGTVELGVSVSISLGDIQFGLSCAPSAGVENLIATTNVEGGIDPSTTTSTIPIPTTTTAAPTTTAAAAAATTSPKYTG